MNITQEKRKWYRHFQDGAKISDFERCVKLTELRNKLTFKHKFQTVHVKKIFFRPKVKELTFGTADSNDIILNINRSIRIGKNPEKYFKLFKRWGKWYLRVTHPYRWVKLRSSDRFTTPQKILTSSPIIKIKHNDELNLYDETVLKITL